MKKKKEEKPNVLRRPGVSNEEQAEEIEKKNEELRRQLNEFMKQPKTEEVAGQVRRNLQDDVPRPIQEEETRRRRMDG